MEEFYFQLFLRGCFSRFLNCTNGTKSRNASHIEIESIKALCKSSPLNHVSRVGLVCNHVGGSNSWVKFVGHSRGGYTKPLTISDLLQIWISNFLPIFNFTLPSRYNDCTGICFDTLWFRYLSCYCKFFVGSEKLTKTAI